jgi:hypothetical protein
MSATGHDWIQKTGLGKPSRKKHPEDASRFHFYEMPLQIRYEANQSFKSI